MQKASTEINDNHQQNLAATTAAMDIRHHRFTSRLIAVAATASAVAVAAIIVAVLI